MFLRRREVALVTLLFLALTAAAMAPFANVVEPVLPDNDDAEFSVWRLSWIAHQLVTDPAHLFDGNIFHPSTGTLAYSDAMLGVGLAGAPFIWAGVHPVVVHNLLLLAAVITTGVATFALCHAITRHTGASIAGGAIFAFAPYRIAHIGHLELQWTAFMPLTLLLLHRAIGKESPRVVRTGISAGALVALQGLASLYYLVFFAIYLAGWLALSLAFAPHDRRRPLVASGAVIAVTAVVLLAPYLMVYASARNTLGPRRSEEIQQFSARPKDYLRVSSASTTYATEKSDAEDERSLFPGFAAAALAVCGVLLSRRRVRFVYVVLALWCFDLSLGVHGVTYPVLLRLVPLLTSFRAPARFGVLVLLSIAMLASLGISELAKRLGPRATHVFPAVAVLVCLVEYRAAPPTRANALEPSNVYRWLASQHGTVIVEFPTTYPSTLWGRESWYEYNSIYHWQRLVNGYSGYPPKQFLTTMEIIKDGSPEEIAQRLRELGVDYLVLHENLYGPAAFGDALTALANLPGAGEPLTFNDPNDPAIVIPLGR